MSLLVESFNPDTIAGLMCRGQISVSYEGYIYDCDFNQMIDIRAENTVDIRNFDIVDWMARNIKMNNHCYGCTAGIGSSCGGAIT